MRTSWTIAWRDFRAYFVSPIGYCIIAAFLAIMGWFFFNYLYGFILQTMKFKAYNMGKGPSLVEGIVRPLYANMNLIFLFTIPAITMRLYAEERKNHSIELLMTAPLTLTQLVVGKFLSSLLFLLVILAFTLVYPVVLLYAGNPDPGAIFSTYLGTLLLGCCYLALGSFFSAMTENQIIAYILTLFGILFCWVIGWAAQAAGSTVGDVLHYLSLIEHFFNFTNGVIDSVDVVYYLSFIGIFLFLTHRILDSYRWR